MGMKFENVYIRCNLACDGTIPETGDYASSPDMFSNGTEALADFTKVLATEESYKVQPEDRSTILRDNYCYLRCRNNTDHALAAKAQMFYTVSSVVLWPSEWMAMEVDLQNHSTINTISETQPGAIGVVERPFIWNKPKAPATNDHYCYIGRLFTEETENPIPSVNRPIDMCTLIQTNLMYAQRNISIAQSGTQYDGYYNMLLTAPATLEKGGKFHLFLYPHNVQGWDVEITCSMKDSEGHSIGLSKTRIQSNDDLYCGQCYLEPGFSAFVSVYLYANGQVISTDTYTRVVLEYAVQDDDMQYLRKNGILLSEGMLKLTARKGIVDSDTIGTCQIGSYTAKFC